jgi:hypothetical protein
MNKLDGGKNFKFLHLPEDKLFEDGGEEKYRVQKLLHQRGIVETIKKKNFEN